MENYKNMIMVHGDLFEFDISREHLTEVGNPENVQSLLKLYFGAGFAWGVYDIQQKSFISIEDYTAIPFEKGRYSRFIIPLEVIYSSATLSLPRIEELNVKSLLGLEGYLVVTGKMAATFEDAHPEMTIDGITYTVDRENGALRQKNDPSLAFTFNEEGESQQYYHRSEKKPITIGLQHYPGEVVGISFPDMETLDTLSTVIEYSWNLDGSGNAPLVMFLGGGINIFSIVSQ